MSRRFVVSICRFSRINARADHFAEMPAKQIYICKAVAKSCPFFGKSKPLAAHHRKGSLATRQKSLITISSLKQSFLLALCHLR